MKREVVLDTETTGFEPSKGHRIVEIGCIELINHVPTGDHYHVYVNPKRDMPDSAFQVHGLAADFLSQHPPMEDHVEDFINYLGDSPLVIHNAKFDMKFINAELEWLEKPTLPMSRAIDTLAIARKKFPGSPATLDALCKRFEVDNSNREKHGALLDSELLAAVYLELIGGKQATFNFDKSKTAALKPTASSPSLKKRDVRKPRHFDVTEEEQQAHKELISKLREPLWK